MAGFRAFILLNEPRTQSKADPFVVCKALCMGLFLLHQAWNMPEHACCGCIRQLSNVLNIVISNVSKAETVSEEFDRHTSSLLVA